jgi:hypothetical protein
MSDQHREYFEIWFGDFLDPLPDRAGRHRFSLQDTPDSGSIVMMATLPLLKRYMRGKSGGYPGSLKEDHRRAFRSIFTNLTDEEASTFWDYCRNGLLHQTTFKSEALHFQAEGAAISLGKKPKEFVVNPRAFCKAVMAAIRNDFANYVAAESRLQRLPTVTVNQFTNEMSTCVDSSVMSGLRDFRT